MNDSYKIVVTGGAGFIGSHLVDALLERGHQVVCLDNFSTGKRENLAAAMNHPKFTLFEGDIRSIADCHRAVAGCKFVLHQAALGSVPRSVHDPATSTDVNTGGFVNMLTAARDAGIRRFVYASSSSVYGDSKELPKVEEHTGNLLSPYAITKFTNELYAAVFSRLYGMEMAGLRYFNVFGPRQDPNSTYAAVIPLWVKQLKNHERPVINGDGEYSRDFTYVDNVVDANIKAMLVSADFLKNGEGHACQVFNIACGERTTLNELFRHLRDALAQRDPQIADIQPVHGPTRPGDIPHSLATIHKAERLLSYKAVIDIQAGILNTVN